MHPFYDSRVQLTLSGRTLGVELTRDEADELQSHVDSIVRRRPPQNHSPMVGAVGGEPMSERARRLAREDPGE